MLRRKLPAQQEGRPSESAERIRAQYQQPHFMIYSVTHAFAAGMKHARNSRTTLGFLDAISRVDVITTLLRLNSLIMAINEYLSWLWCQIYVKRNMRH